MAKIYEQRKKQIMGLAAQMTRVEKSGMIEQKAEAVEFMKRAVSLLENIVEDMEEQAATINGLLVYIDNASLSDVQELGRQELARLRGGVGKH